MSIDWMNPSEEMLAGLDAGRNEARDQIDMLEAELANAEAALAKEREWNGGE